MKEGKRKMTPVLVGVICIIIGILIIFITIKQKPTDRTSSSSKTVQKSSSEISKKGLTKDERNHLKLKNKLEHPYQKASFENTKKCQDAVRDAVNYISSVETLSKVESSYDHHLSMTKGSNLTQLAMIIKSNNYKLDAATVEVSKSDYSDVVQFLCTFKKQGEDNFYYAGNYNINADQLQFSLYSGGSNLGGTYG